MCKFCTELQRKMAIVFNTLYIVFPLSTVAVPTWFDAVFHPVFRVLSIPWFNKGGGGVYVERIFLCLLECVSPRFCFILFFLKASAAPRVNCKLCVP